MIGRYTNTELPALCNPLQINAVHYSAHCTWIRGTINTVALIGLPPFHLNGLTFSCWSKGKYELLTWYVRVFTNPILCSPQDFTQWPQLYSFFFCVFFPNLTAHLAHSTFINCLVIVDGRGSDERRLCPGGTLHHLPQESPSQQAACTCWRMCVRPRAPSRLIGVQLQLFSTLFNTAVAVWRAWRGGLWGGAGGGRGGLVVTANLSGAAGRVGVATWCAVW